MTSRLYFILLPRQKLLFQPRVHLLVHTFPLFFLLLFQSVPATTLVIDRFAIFGPVGKFDSSNTLNADVSQAMQLEEQTQKQERQNACLLQEAVQLRQEVQTIMESPGAEALQNMENLSVEDGFWEALVVQSVKKAEKQILQQQVQEKVQAEEEVLFCSAFSSSRSLPYLNYIKLTSCVQEKRMNLLVQGAESLFAECNGLVLKGMCKKVSTA